jgi:hypothetical protein
MYVQQLDLRLIAMRVGFAVIMKPDNVPELSGASQWHLAYQTRLHLNCASSAFRVVLTSRARIK